MGVMKIVFVVSAMNGGGAERVVATLANRFAVQGDDVTILMVAGDTSVYPLHKDVKQLSIGQPSGGNPFVQIKRIASMRKYFKVHKDCHIVAFSTRINMFAILAAAGIPVSMTVSERNDPNQYNHIGMRNSIYKFGAKNGVKFVFQTKDAQMCFRDMIGRNSTVIANPLRSNLPVPAVLRFSEREKKIAAVGRLEPQKNHMVLLDAFAGFHQSFPEYELHIFGQGSLEQELRNEADHLGIAEYVTFEGFRKDILEAIKTYAMYVLSSDYEGISNSLMEAMALGLPCISTDCPIGGSALCIQDGENGRLTPIGDARALQEAMEWIAQDDSRAEAMGQRAAGIRGRFSEEKICELWRAFIEGSTK